MNLKVTGFIWLEDFLQKIAQKHEVEQQEVREVLADRPRFRLVERKDTVQAKMSIQLWDEPLHVAF